MNRCDLAVQYINIQNGILAHNDYQIPELDITNPDIIFTAEAGSGNLTEQPNDLMQVVKLSRWGLQAYVRGQAEVACTYDGTEMQMITLNV